jgi:hypothetical protein
MDLSFFTRRYVDRSKSTGFQFEFYCDRCNKGHMTPFRIHALGVVTSIWDATDWKKEKEKDFDFDTLKKDVSKLFLKGKAWIEAYTNAVEEAQKYFKHCARCLKWVCPKECYNPRANLCQGCAPLTEAEKAALQAEERKKSRKTAEPADAPRICPHCGKSNPVATFCADCGKKVVQDIFCSSCGAKWSTEKKMKYCPRCGDEMPELNFRTKPTAVKSEAERHVDKAVDTFVDLSTEVKKVADEYKKVAEDFLGLSSKSRESARTSPPQAKASKPDTSKSEGAPENSKTVTSKPQAAKADVPKTGSAKPQEDDADFDDDDLDEDESTDMKSVKTQSSTPGKSQARKKTKIAKSKKQIKGKKPVASKKAAAASKAAQKKSAPASKKPKPKAKKKPQSKS